VTGLCVVEAAVAGDQTHDKALVEFVARRSLRYDDATSIKQVLLVWRNVRFRGSMPRRATDARSNVRILDEVIFEESFSALTIGVQVFRPVITNVFDAGPSRRIAIH
jgi:hypothetical protein